MADYKNILVTFFATVILIAGLASFVAYQNGELSRLKAVDKYANDVKIPQAPQDKTQTNPPATPVEATQPTAAATNNTPNSTMPQTNPQITLNTSKGAITLELFADKMPITESNFIKLAKEGFYDGTKFHRVIEGFMIQGGDPNTKTADTSRYGTGGPGYAIKDEFVTGLSNARGTISMANSGPNTGGSQFFINTVNNTFLDGKHPVFGKVISGMDIVDAISKVPRDARDMPLDPIIVSKVEVK
jgi:peptidylprolyl isomerase